MTKAKKKIIKKKRIVRVIKEQIQQECDSCQELHVTSIGSKHTTCKNCRRYLFRVYNKIKAVEYKGGKCFKCGYSKCLAAVCFHHFLGHVEGHFTEAENKKYKKSYEISKKMDKVDFETLKLELDKTILLCVRCHAETHDGLWLPKKEELNLK